MMVRIPVYESNVATRPVHGQGVEARAIDGAFGSGRGLMALSDGIAKLGEGLERRQELEDTTRAQDAENEFALYMQESMYGENGYMFTQGQHAFEGRKGFMDAAEKKRKEIGARLKPNAAKKFHQVSTARMLDVNGKVLVHAGNGQKQWVKDSSVARQGIFAQDALNAAGNEAEINKQLAGGLLELREQAGLEGWGADVLRLKEGEYVSSVYAGVVQQMAQGDAVAAKEYMESKGELIDPQTRMQLDKLLEAPLYQAKVKGGASLVKLASMGAGGLSEKVATAITTAANRYGVSAEAMAAIAMIESGGNPNAQNPTSSAGGLFQFIDGTAKQYGLINRLDAKQSSDAAARLMRDNTAHLRRVLGREPTAGELYLAHQQGAGGAEKILRNPNARAVDVVGLDAVRLNVPRPKGMSDGDFNAMIGAMSAGEFASLWTSKVDRVMAGGVGIDEALAQIDDDNVREGIRLSLSREGETARKAAKQAKDDTFEWITSQMATYPQLDIDSLPLDMQAQLGIDGILKLKEYQTKALKTGGVQTNDNVYLELTRLYADNPAGFSDVDLLQYRGQLSDSDWKQMVGWWKSARENERKGASGGGAGAGGDGGNGDKLGFAKAKAQAGGQLKGVGLDKDPKLNARFERQLLRELDAFYQQNGRAAGEMEIGEIINALLVPVVINRPGSGWFNDDNNGFLFEMGERLDNETMWAREDALNIPIEDREFIIADLKDSLGRHPDEGEIARRWFEWWTGEADKKAGAGGAAGGERKDGLRPKPVVEDEGWGSILGGELTKQAMIRAAVPLPLVWPGLPSE